MNDDENRKPTTSLGAVRPGSSPTLISPPAPPRPAAINEGLKAHEVKRQGTTLEELKVRQSFHEDETKQTFAAIAQRDQNLVDLLRDQNAALLLIGRELRVQDKLPPSIQLSLPPPADPAPPAPPVLGSLDARAQSAEESAARLEQWAKKSRFAQVLLALGVIAGLVSQLIAMFSH